MRRLSIAGKNSDFSSHPKCSLFGRTIKKSSPVFPGTLVIFESAYKPKILKNWEIPKLNCDRPQGRTGKTKIIANSRGHLLPTIQRSNTNPWGNFMGTWRLPKKIDRKTANQLNGLDQETCKEFNKNPNESIKQTSLQDINEDKESNKENIDNTNIKSQPYIPGDLTEEQQKLPSHDDLAANRISYDTTPSKGFPKIRDDFSKCLPEPKKDISEEVENVCRLNEEMVHTELPKKAAETKKERLLSPILAAISNFNLAKKLHKDNLEHNPLPDTITDSKYRKLQMQRGQVEPGLTLEDKHFATGVGWKGYPGSDPTRCTKLKVYRPKTCGHIKELKDNDSISSFDRKWRFIRQSKVTPMDLAICWDLTPEDPKEEPQRSAHIDGSNGSAAPAVFSLVHTPKDEEVQQKCDGIHGCGPMFNLRTKDVPEKDYFFHRSKTSPPRSRESVKSDESSVKKRAKSAYIAKELDKRSLESRDSLKSQESATKKRAKSAYNLNTIDKQSVHSKESVSSTKSRANSAYNLNKLDKHSTNLKECNNNYNNNVLKNIHQSTPNLSEIDKCSEKNCCKKLNNLSKSRLCVACELKNMSLKEKRPKSDYKMAFKAGIPQKNKTKMHDYPEHWRLATVYQHSYKPIHARKRPLLQTVFK